MNDTNASTYVTKEGLEKLKEELHYLKNVKRREIADRIQQAKELGDLSENAEYVEAKNEQGFAEGRILELEHIIRNAVIIDKVKGGDTVSIGSAITVKIDGEQRDYRIVGSSEADPTSGKISNESPLGKAFIGRKLGEHVEIQTPRGTVVYTVLSID